MIIVNLRLDRKYQAYLKYLDYLNSDKAKKPDMTLNCYHKTLTIKEWSKISSIAPASIRYRVKHNWDIKRAIFAPIGSIYKELFKQQSASE